MHSCRCIYLSFAVFITLLLGPVDKDGWIKLRNELWIRYVAKQWVGISPLGLEIHLFLVGIELMRVTYFVYFPTEIRNVKTPSCSESKINSFLQLYYLKDNIFELYSTGTRSYIQCNGRNYSESWNTLALF